MEVQSWGLNGSLVTEVYLEPNYVIQKPVVYLRFIVEQGKLAFLIKFHTKLSRNCAWVVPFEVRRK
jgi:hypothetical protein